MKCLLVAALLLLPIADAASHPGGLARDGRHYCRTNCSRWNVSANERHWPPMGIVALIGRDVLKSSIMIYNGATGQFSLTG